MADAFDRVRPVAKMQARVGPETFARASEDYEINGVVPQSADIHRDDGSVAHWKSDEEWAAMNGAVEDTVAYEIQRMRDAADYGVVIGDDEGMGTYPNG